jgi:hypothetical protein
MRWINPVLAVLVGMLSGWVAFMILDTTPPYEYDVKQSTIVPDLVENENQQVTVQWKIKRVNRICPGATQRQLFDPKTQVILATYDATPAAVTGSIKDGYLNRTFALPWAVLPPGRIGYRATVSYQCNVLQKFYPLVVATPNLYFYVRQRDSRNDSRYQ